MGQSIVSCWADLCESVSNGAPNWQWLLHRDIVIEGGCASAIFHRISTWWQRKVQVQVRRHSVSTGSVLLFIHNEYRVLDRGHYNTAQCHHILLSHSVLHLPLHHLLHHRYPPHDCRNCLASLKESSARQSSALERTLQCNMVSRRRKGTHPQISSH